MSYVKAATQPVRPVVSSWAFRKLPRPYQTMVSLPPCPAKRLTGCSVCVPCPNMISAPRSDNFCDWASCAAFKTSEYSVPQRILTITTSALARASFIWLDTSGSSKRFRLYGLGLGALEYVLYDNKANLKPLTSKYRTLFCSSALRLEPATARTFCLSHSSSWAVIGAWPLSLVWFVPVLITLQPRPFMAPIHSNGALNTG